MWKQSVTSSCHSSSADWCFGIQRRSVCYSWTRILFSRDTATSCCDLFLVVRECVQPTPQCGSQLLIVLHIQYIIYHSSRGMIIYFSDHGVIVLVTSTNNWRAGKCDCFSAIVYSGLGYHHNNKPAWLPVTMTSNGVALIPRAELVSRWGCAYRIPRGVGPHGVVQVFHGPDNRTDQR